MLTREVVKDILFQNLSIKKLDDRYSIIEGMDKAVEEILHADTHEGISLPKPTNNTCLKCKNKIDLPKAHHTGDGWALWWSCTCELSTIDIEWPYGDGWTGRDTLQRGGFEIV